MKLRTRFLFFAITVHAIMTLMAILVYQTNIYWFLACEALILISVYVTIQLYKAHVKPLNMLASGIETLKEKDFSLTFNKTGHYEMDLLIDVFNSMIKQLREERIQVNEQHFFLEKLIQASPAGIIILNYDDEIDQVNPAALRLLNVNSKILLGKKPSELGGEIFDLLSGLKSGESSTVKGRGSKTFKCHKSHFINKGFHQHFILIEEVTGEILLAEKQAYEKVIRMMSHEINNTVGAVNSLLDSVHKARFQETEDEYSELLQLGIDRNRRMAKFMSNFADVVRLPEVKKEKKDLHQVVRNVHLLHAEQLKQKQIHLDLKLFEGSFFLLFDENQLEQVLINVVKNAAESIEKDGTITLITREDPPQLIIRDTGKGISESAKEKLFSPFFSNKKEGQGIGLTITREILHRHGYGFSLETRPEGYTEFTIEF
ncbi:MAG TPA: ATP-binding protein [Salinimicrobium sp.]|nr:ATP-binding protein [Salinimicrobium sp.]